MVTTTAVPGSVNGRRHIRKLPDGEAKGLIGPVRLGGREQTGWDVQPVRLDMLDKMLPATPAPSVPLDPALHRGSFELADAHDLFVDLSDWGKGTAWINGYHLGRFWRRGPQRTLYVPGPVTRAGANELVILEEEPTGATRAQLVSSPKLGPSEA